MFKTILFVDDDLITQMLCKMVITKAFFSKEIVSCKNGEEALKYYDNLKTTSTLKKPELIFLDLNMPVMNGWEFLDSFKTKKYEEFKDAKIIILSSTIDPDDVEKSKRYPMVIDFLSKPISKKMLKLLKDKI